MITCFDIGGSRIKAGIAQGGAVRVVGDAPTPLDDFATFTAVLAGFLNGQSPQGVAISIAGVVDPGTGRIKVANIACVDGRALADDLAGALHLPVLVLNDADCFALAEAQHGAGRGHRNVFGVILGTGVGGGLVIDGRLVAGAGGYAGEWGHGPVLRDPRFACPCGQDGCIDTVGGARGIERLHLHLHGAATTSKGILDDWAAGDAIAAATIDLWRDLVAPQLAMVLNVVGASIVPVGGGLANVPALITLLDRAVRGMVLRATDQPVIVPAQCVVEPGLIGAAAAGEAAFG